MPADIAMEAHVSPDFAVTNLVQARLETRWQTSNKPRISVPRGRFVVFMVTV
jgi:hypothetical protein